LFYAISGDHGGNQEGGGKGGCKKGYETSGNQEIEIYLWTSKD
jgi:hypothetical protein